MAKTAAELYKERKQRVLDAIALKVPDRVPIFLPFGLFPAKYVGMTFQEAFENPNKFSKANVKTFSDFAPDMQFSSITYTAPIKTLDIRCYKWPGHGVGPNSSQQFVEGEYMKADEYDAFLNDPSDFAMRTFLPRMFGALEGFNRLRPLMGLFFSYIDVAGIFSDEAVIESLEALVKAAKQNARLPALLKASAQQLGYLGIPDFAGGMAFAPFDVISDFS